MTARLTQIWRHPIKGHGDEALESVQVSKGTTLPFDREWAVAHEAAKTDGGAWVPCANFSRGAKAPKLMALSAKLDESSGTVTLSHPEKSPLRFKPDLDDAPFINWVRDLMPDDRAQSARIIRATDRGMTDSRAPTISLGNLSSLRALSDALGMRLDPRRFRINLWVDGLAPWEEFDLIGKDVRIGAVTFHAEEPIERCLATHANPDTGRRDANVLDTLDGQWGHRDFGIFLIAQSDGQIATGDLLETRP